MFRNNKNLTLKNKFFSTFKVVKVRFDRIYSHGAVELANRQPRSKITIFFTINLIYNNVFRCGILVTVKLLNKKIPFFLNKSSFVLNNEYIFGFESKARSESESESESVAKSIRIRIYIWGKPIASDQTANVILLFQK
jgi:hypothetical protein